MPTGMPPSIAGPHRHSGKLPDRCRRRDTFACRWTLDRRVYQPGIAAAMAGPRAMKILPLLLMLCLMVVPAQAALDQPLADPVLEARAVAMGDELRCAVCQWEIQFDNSQAEFARDMRQAGARENRRRLERPRNLYELHPHALQGVHCFAAAHFQANTWLLWLFPALGNGRGIIPCDLLSPQKELRMIFWIIAGALTALVTGILRAAACTRRRPAFELDFDRSYPFGYAQPLPAARQIPGWPVSPSKRGPRLQLRMLPRLTFFHVAIALFLIGNNRNHKPKALKIRVKAHHSC